MSDFTLNQLRYFVALADTLHFGRAAATVRITQPALSQQINKLEAGVGFDLFVRDKRHVSLTEAGTVLVEYARRALAEADRGAVEGSRVARGAKASVHVGFVGIAAAGVVAGAMKRIAALREPVEMSLHDCDTPMAIASLKARTLDVAIIRGPLTETGIRTSTLRRERLFAALPVGHRQAKVRRIHIASLAGERLILFPRRRAVVLHDAITAAFHDAGLDATVQWELSDWPIILSFVGSGLGISVVPESVTRFRSPGCVYRPFAGVRQSVELIAARLSGATTAAVRTVIDAFHDDRSSPSR